MKIHYKMLGPVYTNWVTPVEPKIHYLVKYSTNGKITAECLIVSKP